MTRWCAWGRLNTGHGAFIDTVIFMPEDEEPEVGEWERLDWLDKPRAPHSEVDRG